MICKDRVAIVTGAAGQGMGRSIALTLAREGAKVIVNYLASQSEAEAIVTHIEKRGGEALSVEADILTAEGCQSLVKSAMRAFGQVDICVVGPGGGWHPESIDLLNATAALRDLHDDVSPVYYLMPLVLPGMFTRKWGRFIGIALHPTKMPPAYAYNVSKAARSEAFRLATDQAWSHGVTVNTVAPGPIAPLDSLKKAIEQCDHGDAWTLRENVSPQDIAEGVAFLCSESASYVTGCVIPYMFH